MDTVTKSRKPDSAATAAAVRDRALALGFDAVGFARPELEPAAAERLARFVADGWHGDMGWMESTLDRRRDPRVLWPEARTVIVLGLNYGPAEDPLALLDRSDRANVSVYARGGDYHDVVKKRLKALARWIAETTGADVKVFVDTAPLMEKPLAERAGIGWQGKHTNLVSRSFGSWLFLGFVLTTLDLAPDEAEADYCGTCHRCLDVCPTAAFPEPYRLDARRCISYLTIEHKGHIPEEFRRPMGNRIYGCDDCLAVCPWNKFARRTTEAALLPRPELTRARLADFAALDEAGFRRVFAGSPIKRTGRDRFVRNVLIAIGNSGDGALVPAATRLLEDDAPLVRAMAVWALAQLLEPAAFAALRERCIAREDDTAVLGEWRPARPAPIATNRGVSVR